MFAAWQGHPSSPSCTEAKLPCEDAQHWQLCHPQNGWKVICWANISQVRTYSTKPKYVESNNHLYFQQIRASVNIICHQWEGVWGVFTGNKNILNLDVKGQYLPWTTRKYAVSLIKGLSCSDNIQATVMAAYMHNFACSCLFDILRTTSKSELNLLLVLISAINHVYFFLLNVFTVKSNVGFFFTTQSGTLSSLEFPKNKTIIQTRIFFLAFKSWQQ